MCLFLEENSRSGLDGVRVGGEVSV